MIHILRTSTEHKTASLADEGSSAYCQSSGAHNINTYKPMKINIERSPQHWCPSEGSNSQLFAQENDTLTARPGCNGYCNCWINNWSLPAFHTSCLNNWWNNREKNEKHWHKMIKRIKTFFLAISKFLMTKP